MLRCLNYILFFCAFFSHPLFANDCYEISRNLLNIERIENINNQLLYMKNIEELLNNKSDICAFYLGKIYYDFRHQNKIYVIKAEKFLLRASLVLAESDSLFLKS